MRRHRPLRRGGAADLVDPGQAVVVADLLPVTVTAVVTRSLQSQALKLAPADPKIWQVQGPLALADPGPAGRRSREPPTLPRCFSML